MRIFKWYLVAVVFTMLGIAENTEKTNNCAASAINENIFAHFSGSYTPTHDPKILRSITNGFGTVKAQLSNNHVEIKQSSNLVESILNTKDITELTVLYCRLLTASLAYVNQPRKILMIGLGGGTITNYIHHYMPELKITVVEINPAMLEVAKEFCNVKPNDNYQVVIADGIDFLKKIAKEGKENFDLIILDAYIDSNIAYGSSDEKSLNFLQLVKRCLAEGGVVAQNCCIPSTPAKILEQFTDTFNVVDYFYPASYSNVVLIGYQNNKNDQELQRQALNLQEKFKFRYQIDRLLELRKLLKVPNNQISSNKNLKNLQSAFVSCALSYFKY